MPTRFPFTVCGWMTRLGIAVGILCGGTSLERQAQAQIQWNTGTLASVVANTGLSEVLGDIILTAKTACGTSADGLCTSVASTIEVTFQNVTIDNSATTGIRVCESFGTPCNEPGILMTGDITASGNRLSIGIRPDVDVAAGDRIIIAGVRARVAESVLRTAGLEATAVVSSTPPTAISVSPDPLVVAHSADPLLVQIFSVPGVPCMAEDAIPTVLITEGYPAAFVDHGDTAGRSFPGPPLLPRTPLGGNANSRVRLLVSGLPADLKIQWPLTITAQNATSKLDLLAQSANGSTATYLYETPNQLQSDNLAEIFAARLRPVNFTFSGTQPLSGTVTIQAQMNPPATPENFRPRFDHPPEPEPAAPFFLLRRCAVPQTATGKIELRATVDGLPWTGTLNYRLEGPALLSGTQVDDTLSGVPIGNYAAIRLSGGPAGATFSNITPADVQAVNPGSTVEFNFNFTGPTIAHLELSATPLAVCGSASSGVGEFRLRNATADMQIIPGGTVLTFTFSNIIDTLPNVTGLGAANISSSAVSVSYQIPTAVSLLPGAAIRFANTRLNLNGVANGQNVAVQAASQPSGAVQFSSSQVVVATVSAQACVPMVTLSVTPASIPFGQSATLQWSSQNAATLNLQPGIGNVPPQGTLTVSPDTTTKYFLTATGPLGTAQASALLTVTGTPVFNSSNVANGASLQSGLTPGSIATITGKRLTTGYGTVPAGTIPLPTELAGSRVLVNGVAAPLLMVGNVNGQERITFQVPWELEGQTIATLEVNNNGEISAPVQVSVSPSQPGIFTTDGTAGAILHGDNSGLVTPSHPTMPNSSVVIYATGLGPVSFPPATGAAALAEPLSAPTTTPQVTIAGLPASVTSARLVPGAVGLYEVRVQVPGNAPAGSQDVVLRVGNQASPPVKIAIQ